MKRKRIEDYGKNKLNSENMLLKMQKLNLNPTIPTSLKEVTNTIQDSKLNKQIILRPSEPKIDLKLQDLKNPYVLYKEPALLTYKDPNKQIVLYTSPNSLTTPQISSTKTTSVPKKQEDVMDLGD